MRQTNFTYRNDYRLSNDENLKLIREHMADLQQEADYLEAMAYLEGIASGFTLTRPEYLMGHYSDKVYHPLDFSSVSIKYSYHRFNAIDWLDSGLDQLDYSVEHTKDYDWDGSLPDWAVKAYAAAVTVQRHWMRFHSEY